jgi:DtxR family Mn-dependent transcriptional regulator
MKVWKSFEEHEITHSMAHYLMAIKELHRSQGYCRVTDVARDLEITPGSASVSIKALKTRGWVEEDHNRFLRLSAEGERIASEIHVANRAMVSFLVEVLGVSSEQAEVDACKMEHLVSGETLGKLLGFLHFLHQRSDPVTAKFLQAWREHRGECPGPANCEMCADDSCKLQCLLHEHQGHKHDHGHRQGHKH